MGSCIHMHTLYIMYIVYILDLLSRHGFIFQVYLTSTSACFWESLTTATYFPTCNIFVLSDSQKDHESIAGRHEHCEAFCSFDGHGLRTFKVAGCFVEALRWAVKNPCGKWCLNLWKTSWFYRNDETEWWKVSSKIMPENGERMELAHRGAWKPSLP